ncbi:2-hydroxymuconic semialdehyde dehydrogenase [Leucobacter triazinivorans]|uniref:2-hydroxymuconic semialdehyde dehydrogenase n=1 Tax=Leucobacter triazinivorans TaxID=1784719 RepID=A0A4P6KCH8_9MICO|nr:2-hydroxymuconic semialdehyde dehydrogenase [Leucobacter triazinivorans]QBE47967.1 2-hydroxymuconic semialdehyde dehydrogenase [Leucobacter triazinivorans]
MPRTAPEFRNFIDNAFVDGRSTYADLNPIDGSTVALVHEADERIVDAAVTAARAALNGAWGDWTAPERAALMRRVADLVEERFEEFVLAEIADTGKPRILAEPLDVTRAVVNFRTFADTLLSEGTPAFLTPQALNYVARKPLGVVAVIVPWNLPLLTLTWKAAPAIACGNAVIVKPSEETPATATLFAEVMRDAGAPAGVFNVVHGFGRDSAGQYLTEHPGIDAVTFTGSTATGSTIMRAVAPRVLPVSFELGGKNAALVFEDCDVDRAVAGLERSVFLNTGQVCLCTERVYVHRSIFDEVTEKLVARAEALRLGDPLDRSTTTGPLISQAHRAKVEAAVAGAISEGAQLLTGGGRPSLPAGLDADAGAWFAPTLWTGLDNSAVAMREEIFGPVAGLVPFDTEEEAVALANDTDYGLAASVWTENVDRAHRVAPQMRVGLSWINSWYARELRAPFGGAGRSGIGREGGGYSLDFYSTITNVSVAS